MGGGGSGGASGSDVAAAPEAACAGARCCRQRTVIIPPASPSSAVRHHEAPQHVLPANDLRPRQPVLHPARTTPQSPPTTAPRRCTRCSSRPTASPALDAFKLARQREREASDKISQELVEQLHHRRSSARTSRRSARRCTRSPSRSRSSPTATRWRADHLERHRLRAARGDARAGRRGRGADGRTSCASMKLEPMKALNDQLRAIENEADRLMLELYRDIYSGRLDACRCSCSRTSSRSWRRPSTAAARPASSRYQIVLKNS